MPDFIPEVGLTAYRSTSVPYGSLAAQRLAGYCADTAVVGMGRDLLAIGYQGPSYAILPALVLAIELAPVMIRSIAVSVANNLHENYVSVGEVRGLRRRRMITHHVLRNAAIPLLNLFGIQVIGMLLGSLFVVEYIFNYPGIGLLMINAVFQRDFPIIQAIAMLSSAVLVCVNILVDLAATNIDRRLQY